MRTVLREVSNSFLIFSLRKLIEIEIIHRPLMAGEKKNFVKRQSTKATTGFAS
jgi:hypothetical protein